MKKIIDYLNTNQPKLFDVGAKGGAQDFLPLLSSCTTVGFEPNPAEFKKLTTTSHTKYFNLALYNKNGEQEFYITKNPSYSSFNKINEAAYTKHFADDPRLKAWLKNCEIEKTINCKTVTLDGFCEENKIKQIDFLKLDTQGSELAILQGAKKMLDAGKISIIKTEFLFNGVYHNQASFYELQSFLVSYGYELLKIEFVHAQKTDSKNAVKLGDKFYKYAKSNNGGDAYFIFKDEPKTEREKIKLAVLLAFLHQFNRSALILNELKEKLPFTILELHNFAAKQSSKQKLRAAYKKIAPGFMH